MGRTVTGSDNAANPISHSIRQQCRTGTHSTSTVNLAPGHIQANLLILPSRFATDFISLCRRNPVPCPLLAQTPIGNPTALLLMHSSTPNQQHELLIRNEFDIRTDLPQYNIYRNGELVKTKTDVQDEWTADHVAFLIGCSFSFEAALAKASLTPRHSLLGQNVSMYRTKRRLAPVGVFVGATYVVSMRPYRECDVDRVRDITRPYLEMHGEPIDWGWDACERLGIRDINVPDFGEAVEIKCGEVPVFWVCFPPTPWDFT